MKYCLSSCRGSRCRHKADASDVGCASICAGADTAGQLAFLQDACDDSAMGDVDCSGTVPIVLLERMSALQA